MRLLSLLLWFSLPLMATAQRTLKGVVLDAEKNQPVPKASVFLSNTSVGTTADEEGKFTLFIPAGKFDLVVSSVGYATYNQTIIASEAAADLTIKLKPKAPELETVIIEPYEKDGWEKWGVWFIENFLGTSEFGRDSRIKNPEVLKFRNSRQNKLLTVVAIAPLVIENQGLGYRITYQLENFRYDFKSRYLLYAGYPFFEDLGGSDRKRRKWEKAREEVYYGSMLHFMRAVFRNKLGEEGFEVRRLQKLPNEEKQRVRALYRTAVQRGAARTTLSLPGDSTAYYNRVLGEPDFKDLVGSRVLTGDSIAYAVDSTVAGFDFADYLWITYKPKKAPPEFRTLYPRSDGSMTSELTLVNGKPIEVMANGAYFNPEDLLSSGFWGWWEKMGTLLPFDYRPPKK